MNKFIDEVKNKITFMEFYLLKDTLKVLGSNKSLPYAKFEVFYNDLLKFLKGCTK